MPSISPGLFSEWIQPGAVVAVAGLLLASFRGLRSDLKEEIRASEARQEQRMNRSGRRLRRRWANSRKPTEPWVKSWTSFLMSSLRQDLRLGRGWWMIVA